MEAVAKIKNCPMSPRKMRLVVNNIRGKKVGDALSILRYTKNEAGTWLEKLLLSAIANWEYKLDGAESADDYNLIVKTVFVDEAAMLKRFRPATHGRAARIHKRRNHVTLIVENKVPLERDLAPVEEAEG
ncbi:MAG: 50S ribosomal protein L22 [Saprospiraceae bacterium]|nr:50S ribosomal protein L22 [Saprospiraceae bacterium]MCF8251761.1 50S ribosomal protein L22 [Saprospiraceae bacterium]MCF8281247.1 50S ribosomal protein L22 [Bacteroidales bacterium]MCF8313403.1 50S ribosomal protein L22 [Saprospiraceae bacterium]MCF8442116.1 50S ribosomal protein L22 [Saprospiraceae bacterium]